MKNESRFIFSQEIIEKREKGSFAVANGYYSSFVLDIFQFTFA